LGFEIEPIDAIVKKESGNQEKLVEHVAKYLGDKFKIEICGGFGKSSEELEDDESKFVEIAIGADTYSDWHYEDFNEKSLKLYAESTLEDLAMAEKIKKNYNEEVSKKYFSLSTLLIEALKTYKK
jgi:hypothetical protein